MTTDYYKISILMNSHNGAKYIYDSVSSIIAQTYKNWELVFFDNCSDDDSQNIIKKFDDKRIKYFYSKKILSLGQARKNAETYLNGDFIAILDVDDLWLPNKLKNQIEILLENIDTSFIFTAVNFFNKSNSKNFYPYQKFIKKNFFKELLFNYRVPLESILINKKYINKLQYFFDDKYNSITDFDLLLRLSENSKVIYIPEITASWRLHDNNDTVKYPFYFVDEKKEWLKNNKEKINNINPKYFYILNNKNEFERIRITLNVYGRAKSLKELFKLKNYNIKFLIYFFFILCPFSRLYLKKRHNKYL